MTLIVEDDAIQRWSLRELLRTRFPSMNIEEAEDGKEALEKLRTCVPDLVFMDIGLPGLNGLEVTRRIKVVHGDTVVIVFTSFDRAEYREAAFRNGASYFFTKGQTGIDEIIASVESILSESKGGNNGKARKVG